MESVSTGTRVSNHTQYSPAIQLFSELFITVVAPRWLPQYPHRPQRHLFRPTRQPQDVEQPSWPPSHRTCSLRHSARQVDLDLPLSLQLE